MLLLLLLLLSPAQPSPVSLEESEHRATHVPPESGKTLWEWLTVWPNTYYDKPRYRYPYYDEKGTGKLLYGYGGRTLYKYTDFRHIEGYYRK